MGDSPIRYIKAAIRENHIKSLKVIIRGLCADGIKFIVSTDLYELAATLADMEILRYFISISNPADVYNNCLGIINRTSINGNFPLLKLLAESTNYFAQFALSVYPIVYAAHNNHYEIINYVVCKYMQLNERKKVIDDEEHRFYFEYFLRTTIISLSGLSDKMCIYFIDLLAKLNLSLDISIIFEANHKIKNQIFAHPVTGLTMIVLDKWTVAKLDRLYEYALYESAKEWIPGICKYVQRYTPSRDIEIKLIRIDERATKKQKPNDFDDVEFKFN
jgi:hypothetical protein